MNVLRTLASALLGLYRREPARANQLAAVALSWLVLKLGLKVDDSTTLLVATSVLTYAAGELTRWLVVPTATVNQVIRDETADIERQYKPEPVKPQEWA